MDNLKTIGLARNLLICFRSGALVILSVLKESIWKILPLAAFISAVMAASKTLPDGALASRSKLRASDPAKNWATTVGIGQSVAKKKEMRRRVRRRRVRKSFWKSRIGGLHCPKKVRVKN